MTDTHELKTHPSPFQAIVNGYKLFELRHDDGRGFKLGDRLVLREWYPGVELGEIGDGKTAQVPGDYSGRLIEAEITYILRAPKYGLTNRLCVMSFKILRGVA